MSSIVSHPAQTGVSTASAVRSPSGLKALFYNLDYLRSLAVLTVMVDHLMPTLTFHGHALPAWLLSFTTNIGHAGVLAFFVHTSLVLMQSLERMGGHPTKTALVWRFYARRAFRIYPLALAVIALVLMLDIPASTWKENPPITGKVILANVLLIQNLVAGQSVLAPLWSLPYEVEMYVVLPALYFLSRKARGPMWLGGLIAFFSVAGHLVAQYTGGKMNLFAYIPCFLSGVLCYSLRNSLPRLMPNWAWLVFVPTLITVFCLAQYNQSHPVYWAGWIFCLVLGLSINVFHGVAASSPFAKVSVQIAKYSYGIYLLHVPALYLTFDVLGLKNLWAGVPLYAAITLALSVVAFHLIEQPAMDKGRQLTD